MGRMGARKAVREVGVMAGEEGMDELVLAGVMAIKRAFGDAGALGDVADGGLGDPLADEKPHGGLLDPFACCRAVAHWLKLS